MVNDQEPRYRLVDSNGNVVGSLFQNADGNVEIQDETGTGSVFGPDGIVTPAIDAESVSADNTDTKRVVGNYHFAGAYDGSDADARLGNAISAASTGETIVLESADYGTDRTFSKKLTLVGSGIFTTTGTGTVLNASWTFDDRVAIFRLSTTSGASATFNTISSAWCNSLINADTSITVASDNFRFTSNFGGDLTFNSGTSGGIVDACSQTTVTDNGTNTVGDIA